LSPKKDESINSLEGLFAEIELPRK